MFEFATSVRGSSKASLFETRKASSSPVVVITSQYASDGTLAVLASEVGDAPVPAFDGYLLDLEYDTEVLLEQTCYPVLILYIYCKWK